MGDRMISLAHLTELDKDILKRSWEIVSRNMESLAVDIFEMIFEQAPDAKLMFTFMMRDYREDVKKSSEFTFHALRFIQVIESAMIHLEDPQTLDPLLLNLSSIHARHEEQLGFSSHYWSVFKECVLFHFRKAMNGKENLYEGPFLSIPEVDASIILWREVLHFTIMRMKTGLESKMLIRKANRLEMINNHNLMSNGCVHPLEETKQRITERIGSGSNDAGVTTFAAPRLQISDGKISLQQYQLKLPGTNTAMKLTVCSFRDKASHLSSLSILEYFLRRLSRTDVSEKNVKHQ